MKDLKEIKDIKEKIFNLLLTNPLGYELFDKICDLIERIDCDARGEENAIFYEDTRKLLDSINNAGWEERHSDDIKSLMAISQRIVVKHEAYLS